MDRSVSKHSKSVALVRLSGLNGEDARFIPLEKTKHVIGTSQLCDLSFPNLPKLSRRHAWIYVEKGISAEENWWVVDLKSRNGTFVMNDRIGVGLNNRVKLTHGCRITLGAELTFIFVDNYISRLIGSPKNKVFTNQTCQTEFPPSSLSTELSTVLSEMNCPLCFEYLISPQVLNCSHTFCQWCLSKWNQEYKKSHPYASTSCCPMCRVNIQTTTTQLTLENMISPLLERVLDKTTFEEWKKLIPVRKELLEKMKSEGTNESSSPVTNRYIFQAFENFDLLTSSFNRISRIRAFRDIINQIERRTSLYEIDDEVIDLSDSDDGDNEDNASQAVRPIQAIPRPPTPEPELNDNFFAEFYGNLFSSSSSEDEETPEIHSSRNRIQQEQSNQFRFRSLSAHRRLQQLQPLSSQNQPGPNRAVQPSRASQRSSSQPLYNITVQPNRQARPNRGNIHSNNRANNISIANRRNASNEQSGAQARVANTRTQRTHPYQRDSNRRQ